MLLLVTALAGFLGGLLTGGSLRNLVARRLRWPLVVIAAFGVKELLIRSPLGDSPLGPAVFAVSLAVLVAWTAWHYLRLPGIWLVTVGVGLNLVVVVANGGRMPVAAAAAQRGPARLSQSGVWAQYAVMNTGTHGAWLGDWILFPGALGRLFPQAYSPGDIVSAAGLAVVLFLATRPARPPARGGAITSR